MDRKCRNCKHYAEGVTNEQRQKWSNTNLGRYATGVCNLYFPRGYICRKPPHPTMATSSCFQFEEKDTNQMTMNQGKEKT